MTMKRWLIALPALALAAQLALAHPHGPPTAEMIDQMTADLGLDANQKQQVQKIFEDQHARMEEERKQYEASGQRPSRDEMRAKHEQARQDLDAQLSTVLTLDQLQKLHKKMDDMRAERWGHKHGPGDSSDKPTDKPADKPADQPADQG